MTKTPDHSGTINDSFRIGLNQSGAKKLIFPNGANTGELIWTPTGNRSVEIPDTSGVLAVQPRVYTFSDIDYSIPSDADIVLQTGTLTANRNIFLPNANEVPAGKTIKIRNTGQLYGGCLDLFVTPFGSQTLEGLPTSTPITFPFAENELEVLRNHPSARYQWSLLKNGRPIGFYSDIYMTGNSGNLPSLAEFSPNLNGTGSSNAFSSGNPGIRLATGTTAAGRSGLRTTSLFAPSFGEIVLRIVVTGVSALSNATDSYILIFGLTDTSISTSISDGIFWFYSHTTNNGAYQGICRNSNVSTVANSNVTVNTTTNPIDLGIWISPLADEVCFFANGAMVGSPIFSNIPLANLLMDLRINKTLGTSSRTIDLRRFRISYKGFW